MSFITPRHTASELDLEDMILRTELNSAWEDGVSQLETAIHAADCAAPNLIKILHEAAESMHTEEHAMHEKWVAEHEARLDAEDALDDSLHEFSAMESAYKASQHEVEQELHFLKHQLQLVEGGRDTLMLRAGRMAAKSLTAIERALRRKRVIDTWRVACEEEVLRPRPYPFALLHKNLDLEARMTMLNSQHAADELAERERDLGDRIFSMMDRDGSGEAASQ